MILKLGQKCCSYSTFMSVNTIIVNASIITFDNEPSRSGTRRLVTKKKWSSASRSGTGDDLICLHSTFELYHQKEGDTCRYHDPGPTSLGEMSKPLVTSRLNFFGHARGSREIVMRGNSPRIFLLHIPPRSSAANISPGGFSAAGLWKAMLDGPLPLSPRER